MQRAFLALLVTMAIATAAQGAAVAPSNPDIQPGFRTPVTSSFTRSPAGLVGPIVNLDTGNSYPSIEDAILDPLTLDGHTIEVQTASHSEGIVHVTKQLTIQGQTGAEVIHATTNTSNSGDGRGWFLVTAPNLTVQNLGFDGTGILIWQGFRIKPGAGGASFDHCTFSHIRYQASGPSYAGNVMVAIDCNMTVTSCTFDNIGRHGIFFFGTGVTAGLATGNTYTGKGVGDWLDYGIELGGGAVATCDDNTITDCLGVASVDGSTSAGVLISTFYGAGTAGDLSGNFVNNCTTGIFAGYDASDVSVVTATSNDLSGDAGGMENTSTTVTQDASGNWWGSNDAATVAAAITGDIDYTPWLGSGTDVGGDPSDGFQGDFSTLYVDDDSPQTGAMAYIEEGLALVTASTVNVEPGTYAETVTLSTSFNNGTLSGNSTTRPIITGGMKLGAGLDGATVENLILRGAGAASSVVRMMGSVLNLTLDNCLIDGELTSGRHGFSGGQLEGDATVSNCEFKDVLGWALFESRSGSGGGGSPLGTVNFTNNNIHNCNGSVVFRGDAGDWTDVVNVTGNTWQTIGGNGSETGEQWAAFEVNRAIDVNVSGNSVNDVNLGNGGEGEAAQLWSIGDLDVSGNTFTNNDQGIWVAYVDGTVAGSITNNTLSGNAAFGIKVDPLATVGPLDATCNWWGTIAGPNDPPGNPTGNDDVLGDVTYAPWLDGPITGTPSCNQYGNNNVAAEPDGDCLSVGNTCETVSVVFNRLDATPARAASVTFQLSSNLELCVDPATSIVRGPWLDPFSPLAFQVLDLGGGSYVVDQAILGLPCGVTTGGVLFTVDVKKKTGSGDGTGTITVTSVLVRDCLNAPLAGIPGAPGDLTIDETPPAALATLAAAQQKTGNDSDGTTKINLSWTAPPESDASTVEVYRKGFGFYPEYDDNGGAAPSAPTDPADAVANGWVLAASLPASATTLADETTARDFYYFVAFVTDDCGNISPVSNRTDGTLNYHLGDVADGVNPPESGDNLLTMLDVTVLGNNYGAILAPNDPVNYLDVGPTTDFSVDGRPTTDNAVQFEDLMMFAINFGTVSMTEPPAGLEDVPAGKARLELVAEPLDGDRTRLHLLLADNPGTVKGIHAVVDLAGGELESARQGALLDAQGNQVFFTHLPEAGAGIHAALLGHGVTIHGQGEVATLVVRGRGSAAARLLIADLRDLDNRFLGDPPPATTGIESNIETALAVPLPERYELLGAVPNPFNPQTTISFRLPQETTVSLRIFDVNGRQVRTLLNRALPAGEHGVTWDGRDHSGRQVGSGVYLYVIEAGELHAVEKLVLLK